MVEILWKRIGIVEKCRKSVAANTQRKALKILVVSIVSIVERKILYYAKGTRKQKRTALHSAVRSQMIIN